MIDTHCHLLPGLDDGPRRLDEALALARQLVDAGVRHVICTPHYSRRFPTDHDLATQRLRELGDALSTAGISLELELAAEIGSAAALTASAAELARRRLGGRYLLVELERDTPAGIVELVVARVFELGCTPVLAHPERCPAVRSQPHILDAARQEGAWVQVVAPSLVGRWGNEAAAAGWHLLESGRVDVLASDAHRARSNGSHLAHAQQLVRRHLGDDALGELTERQPARLIGVEAR